MSPGGSGSHAVRVDLADHVRERRSARRRLVAYRVLGALLVAGVVVGGIWAVFFSSLFALDLDALVVEGAQSEVISGDIEPTVAEYEGVPLPRMPVSGIREELLTRPLIAEAEVSRSWMHGLVVSVVQRVPVAMVVTDAGYALVGSDGVTTAVSQEPVEGLPYIHVASEDEKGSVAQARSAVAVWVSLGETFRSQVSSISADDLVVTLDLVDGSQVIWGDEDESELKAQVLELLVEQRPSAVYDLRDPRRPVTK